MPGEKNRPHDVVGGVEVAVEGIYGVEAALANLQVSVISTVWWAVHFGASAEFESGGVHLAWPWNNITSTKIRMK